MNELAFFTSMQRAMDDAAKDAWNMVSYSRQHRSPSPLRLGEVTLTELNFYRLRNFWTKQVFLLTHEPVEAKTGADWEWVIGHDDKWIAIRVQAKILGTGKKIEKFSHLPHKIGRSGIRQIDLLTTPSPGTTLCRCMPLYVFYASAPPLIRFPLVPDGDARYGCSAVHARTVRKILDNWGNKTDAYPYLLFANRWSSIFDPLVSQLKANQSLASIVDKLHNKPLPRNSLNIADFWDKNQADGACSNPTPDYLATIIESRNDDFATADLASLIVKYSQQDRSNIEPKLAHNLPHATRNTGKINQPDFYYEEIYGAWKGVIEYILESTANDATVNAKRIDDLFEEITPFLNNLGFYSDLPKSLPPKELPSRELTLSGDTEITPSSLPSVVTLIDIDQISTKKPYHLV